MHPSLLPQEEIRHELAEKQSGREVALRNKEAREVAFLPSPTPLLISFQVPTNSTVAPN